MNHQRSTKLSAIENCRRSIDETSVLADSAFELTKLQKTILAMNAHLDLGNLNIMLAVTLRFTVEHVCQGATSRQRIIGIHFQDQVASHRRMCLNRHSDWCIPVNTLARV